LRPHWVTDFNRYLPLWVPGAPDTAAPMVSNPEEVWARLLRFVGHWTHFGHGLFLAEDRNSEEIVGLAHFQRGIGPGFDAAPEAACRVLASRGGEGPAAEAMEAALTWFDTSFGFDRTVCLTQETNLKSLKGRSTRRLSTLRCRALP